MPIQRIHYSAEKIEHWRPCSYLQDSGRSAAMKPQGLWYSCEGSNLGWKEWCEAEDFRIEDLTHGYVLEIDFTQMLVIRTTEELDAFHDEYNIEIIPSIKMRRIDWEAVAKRYTGIEIEPYNWQRRLSQTDVMDMLWYYGWDCASGCIWELDALVSFNGGSL